MIATDKLSMLKTLLGISADDTSSDERLEVYLYVAEREILAWRYSLADHIPSSLPAEYDMIQVHAVIAGYSISGAENQTTHSENGINRTYKYEDMIAYIHAHVLPMVRCI